MLMLVTYKLGEIMKGKKQRRNSFFKKIVFFSVIALLCLLAIFSNNSFSKQNNIVAHAALNIISGSDFFSTFYSNSSNVNGHYTLMSDITLDYTNFSNNDYLKKTFSGSFNGNNKTITINGNKTLEYSGSTALNAVSDVQVGLLFGNLSNFRIYDLKIIYNAKITIKHTNPQVTIPGSLGESTIVSTTYSGIISGKSRSATLDDIEITTSDTSLFFVEGVDNKSGFSVFPKQNIYNDKYDVPIDRSVAASAGILAGIGESINANGLKINHKGLVLTKSHCKIAGKEYTFNSKGNKQNYGHNSDNGSEAGMFIGTTSNLSSINLNYITVMGDGVITALLKGDVNATTQYIYNDFAGVFVGKNHADAIAFNVKGIIYNFEGWCVVSTGSATSHAARDARLLFGGTVSSSNTSLSYMFRDNATNNPKVSTYSQVNISPPSSASTVKTAANSNKIEAKNQNISVQSSLLLGSEGSFTSSSNAEYLIPVRAGNNENIGIVSGATISYSSFEKISANERHIKISVDLNASSRYISALSYYKSSDASATDYISIYVEKTRQYNFTISLNYHRLVSIQTYTQSTYSDGIIYSNGSTDYTTNSADKAYDGIRPTVYTRLSLGSVSFAANLVWECTHTPILGYTAEPAQTFLSSAVIDVPKTAGLYSIVLRKKASNNNIESLSEGDVIAGDSDKNPSQVYTYSSSIASQITFTFTITQLQVGLSEGNAAVLKYYDGTDNLGVELSSGTHYILTGIESVDEGLVHITFTSAKFADSSIGSGKTINISGIAFNVPNYMPKQTTLTLSNGNIEKRRIGYRYLPNQGGYMGTNGEYRFNYSGNAISPSIEPLDIVANEQVSFNTSIHLSNQLSAQPISAAIDVGRYYFRLSLHGTHKDNYTIADPEVTSGGRLFHIDAKQIGINWIVNGNDITSPEYTKLIYNSVNQKTAITNSSAGIYERDYTGARSIVWNYTFSSLADNTTVEFINAGSYKVEVDMYVLSHNDNKIIRNYTIIATEKIETIEIDKFAFSLQYEFGDESFTNLIYNSTDLSLNIKAVQMANEVPTLPRIELNKVALKYYVIQSDNSAIQTSTIRNVGQYKIEPSYSNAFSNFKIVPSDNEFMFSVNPKNVNVIIPQKEFTYRARDIKSFITYHSTGIESSDSQSVFITVDTGVVTDIVSVGDYTGTVKISSPNYVAQVIENGVSIGNEIIIKVTPYDLSITYPASENMPTLNYSSISNFEYTSNPITPNVNLQLRRNDVLLDTLYREQDYSLTYYNNINVGTATVKVTGLGNYKNSKDFYFDITKINLGFRYVASSVYIYDSTDLIDQISFVLEKSLASSPAEVRLAFYYRGENESGYTPTNSIINSGTYYVVNSLSSHPNNDNYFLSETMFPFTINKREARVTFSGFIGLIYDGNAKSINCNLVQDNLGVNDKNNSERISVALTYTRLSRQGEVVQPENLINANLYSAKANLVGTASTNYRLYGDIYLDFTIAKMIVHPEYTYGNLVYDTLDKKGEISINNDNDVIPQQDSGHITSWYIKNFRYEISPGNYSDVLTSVIRAGNYILESSLPTSTLHRASNYTVSNDNKFYHFTVQKAEIQAVFTKDNIDISSPPPPQWDYNGERLNISTKLDITDDNAASPQAKVAMRQELSSAILSPAFYILDDEGNETQVEGPLNSGNYVARIEGETAELTNYVLTDSQSQIEIEFIIRKRLVSQVVWGQSTVSGPYNAKIREINPSSPSVIGGDDVFETLAYKEVGGVFPSNPIDLSEIRDAGTYKVVLQIIDSNYDFTASAATEKSFSIQKLTVNFKPPTKEVTQIFGSPDQSYSYNYKVLHGQNSEEDIIITLSRVPGNDVRADNNGIYPFIAASTNNSNYIINLEQSSDTGVRIVKYEHIINPRPSERTYDGAPAGQDFDLTENIVVALSFRIVNFNIKYTVSPDAQNAGSYDYLSFEWEKINGLDHPDKKNINVIISEENLKNKYTIQPKTIALTTTDLNFDYGEPIRINDIFSSFQFTNPQELGDTSANTNKGRHVYIAVDGIPNQEDLDNGQVDYKIDGYSILITMQSPNYICQYQENKIYINKRLISRYMVDIPLSKVYDGTDTVLMTSSPWHTPTEVDIVAVSRGLSVSARYEDKNVNTNKRIYVRYYVDSRYSENFELPEEYEFETRGSISAKEINLVFNVNESQVIYGDNLDISIQQVNLVPGETLESQGITIYAYANVNESQIKLDNLKNVGIYYVKIEVINNDTNYIFNNSAQAKLVIKQRQIGIEAADHYIKYQDGTINSQISSDNYKFTNVLSEEDKEDLFIFGYTEELDSSSPQEINNFVTVRNIQLQSDSGAHNNYILEIEDVLLIKARVIPIFRKLTLISRAYDFDNTPKEISYEVEDLATDARVILKYAGLLEKPVNAGTYQVTSFVELNNFQVECEPAELTIRKIAPQISLAGNFRQIYGDFKPITAKATSGFGLNADIIVKYSFDSYGYFHPPAGDNHEAIAIFEETNNYKARTIKKKLIIIPKDVTITFDGYNNLSYTGKDQSSKIDVKVNGAIDGDDFVPYKIFRPAEVINAGDYSLSVTSKNSNYVISGISSLNFSIKKANLNVKVIIDDTTASKKPEYKIIYEGFIQGENVEDIDKEPMVIISQSKMGENSVVPVGGAATNYNFVFEEKGSKYNVVSTQPSSAISKSIPILIIGGLFGLSIVVLSFALFARKRILRKAVKRRH